VKLLFRFINLILLFFWLSYALDPGLPVKITTDRVESLSQREYRGRHVASGNYYITIRTSDFSFNIRYDEKGKLKKGDAVIIRSTPIYGIVDSYCMPPGADNCLMAEDSPYREPFYTILISILAMFILYTLLFEREMRFLKRLTLGNTITTIIFAFIFIFLYVIL